MANKRKLRDFVVVIAAWLIAAALVYIVIIKFKFFFHK